MVEVIPPGKLTPDEMEDAFVDLYLATRQARRDSWFDGGEILLAMKEKLPHGRWLPALQRLGVSKSSAEEEMRIASDPNLLRYRSSNSRLGGILPSRKKALYALTGMEPARFDALIEAGKIHPELRAPEIKVALAHQRHTDPPALPDGKFRVIVADPPWPYTTWSDAGKGRSPEQHYKTMTMEEIAAKGPEVKERAAPDCALFLWVPAGPRRDYEAIIDAWGFAPEGEAFVWTKQGALSTGYVVRYQHETCLRGQRGSPKRRDAGVGSWIDAPRGAHSVKPDEFYRRVERLYAGPYLELFGRRARPGWTVWGSDPALAEGAG